MQVIKSPFPGMDPFLEKPSEWGGVHADIIIASRNALIEVLPANFRVKVEGEVKILDQGDTSFASLRPDVYLTKVDTIREASSEVAAVAASPIVVTPFFEHTIELRWLEIVDRRSRQVVTTIEVLSPFNKVGRGYEEFHRKRSQVMATQTNWVEIDLLRIGKRPFELLEDMPDYYALVKKGRSFDLLMWKIDLKDSLPTIHIPLADGYDAIPLNLQKVLDNVFASGLYAADLEYDKMPPPPRLSAENQKWLDERLAEWRKSLPQ